MQTPPPSRTFMARSGIPTSAEDNFALVFITVVADGYLYQDLGQEGGQGWKGGFFDEWLGGIWDVTI